ncbi:hypothetical protein MKW98_001033 [Papaver atlanticum]|uniref:Uncharacterized protein n=1 Tax=Papaver atlanticum TaxID=357466 RepID=A0AAD4TC67_9MAGN|nr:hypothetical protein MKW98_001033 [Papaver atlanticum]
MNTEVYDVLLREMYMIPGDIEAFGMVVSLVNFFFFAGTYKVLAEDLNSPFISDTNLPCGCSYPNNVHWFARRSHASILVFFYDHEEWFSSMTMKSIRSAPLNMVAEGNLTPFLVLLKDISKDESVEVPKSL